MTNTDRIGRHTVFFAAAAALMMVAHLQGGKTVRDALFLSYFDVTDLPKMMIATAVASALAVVVFSRLLARYGPARLTPLLFFFSAILSLGEWVALALWPKLVILVLYLHVTVIDALLISGFWSIINERYDPYSAKTIISHMAAFTALGGLCGAGAASLIARLIDTRAVIAMLAILHLSSGLALAVVTRGQTASEEPSRPVGLMRVLAQNTLIQRIALIMLVLSGTIALLDYLFKAALQSTLSREALVTYFAYFYITIDIGTFFLHTFIGRKALRWLGLGGTIAVLPISILFGGLLTFVFRSLMTVTLLRGAASLLTNSFFGPGYELLYTPIAKIEKRTSKILIDVGANRAGNMLGGLVIMGLLLLPGPTSSYILLGAIICAGVMGLLILLLNRGYLSQLVANLQNEALATKAGGRQGLTTGASDGSLSDVRRERLLRKIARYHDTARIPRLRPASTPDTAYRTPSIAVKMNADSEVEAILALRSGEDERIRHVLVNKTVTPALLAHVLPLLQRRTVLREVLNACQPLASAASGQLVDVMLDQHQHPLVRRRIPLLLWHADNTLAVQGLTIGLQDRALDVRFRCAEALVRIKTRHPHLAIDTEAIWQVIYREIAFLSSSGFKASQGVEPLRHLFNLLGLIFGTKVMDICYASLQAQNSHIRGTALEYLENQLPPNVRAPLWPLIAADHRGKQSDRPAEAILNDLLLAGGALKKGAHLLEESMNNFGKPK